MRKRGGKSRGYFRHLSTQWAGEVGGSRGDGEGGRSWGPGGAGGGGGRHRGVGSAVRSAARAGLAVAAPRDGVTLAHQAAGDRVERSRLGCVLQGVGHSPRRPRCGGLSSLGRTSLEILFGLAWAHTPLRVQIPITPHPPSAPTNSAGTISPLWTSIPSMEEGWTRLAASYDSAGDGLVLVKRVPSR